MIAKSASSGIYSRMRFLPAIAATFLALVASARATDFPTIKAPLSPVTVARGDPIAAIDLRNHFEITSIQGQVVQFRTSQGNFNLEMFPAAAPLSVPNFLNYVNVSRYSNTIVHRSDQGLGVIQGGGYSIPTLARIAADPPIALESALENTRGTLAMARTNVPDSATTEWFINTVDNTSRLPSGVNNGYAVFGRVTGTGMTVVDAIHALPVYDKRANFGSAFGQMPLTGYSGTGNVQISNAVVLHAAQAIPLFPSTAGEVAVVTFAVASNSNPGLVTPTVSGSALSLTLTAGQVGVADLAVSATDTNGNSVQSTFRLTVTGNSAPALTLPASPVLAEATSAAGAAVSFAVTAQDAEDGALTPNVAPASGSVFSLGDTTVNVSATDTAGAQTTGSFVVRVRDTTAPALTPPADLVVEATSASGAWVHYPAATASDAVGVTSLTYSHASGVLFPLGVTTVTVTARDAANNTTTRTFTVAVAFLRPAETTTTAPARSSDPAPGAGTGTLPVGTVLRTFGAPAVSDARDLVARVGMLAGRKTLGGIYREDVSGAASLAAYQGGPVPGIATAGVTFGSFLDPVLSSAGSLAFAARVQGGGVKTTADFGVWTDAFGPELALVLREGSDVPGLPAGARLRAVPSLSLRDGALLALLTLNPAAGVVSASNDTVLLHMTAASTATVLLREGSELAGFTGSRIRSFSLLSPALLSPGHGRWHADGAVVAKVLLTDGRTLLVKIAPTGAVTPLLSTADLATLVDAQARWRSFGLPALGSDGAALVVAATLQQRFGGVSASNDGTLLFSADGIAWSLLARERDPAPIVPAGPLYAAFYDPVVNDAGDVAFLATLQGTGVSKTSNIALFSGQAGALRVIARRGQPAPDATGAATGAVWSRFLSVALPSGPGAGAILLAETAGGDTTTKNKRALWAVDSQGTLRRLLRTNDTLTTGGSPITALTLLNAVGGAFGATRSFNATGSVALLATLADRSQVLVRVEIP
jgi:cyclophilin family peptidyl-prolyl cis-trans isomerase